MPWLIRVGIFARDHLVADHLAMIESRLFRAGHFPTGVIVRGMTAHDSKAPVEEKQEIIRHGYPLRVGPTSRPEQ